MTRNIKVMEICLADQLHVEGVVTDDIRQFAIRRNMKPARCYLSVSFKIMALQ